MAGFIIAAATTVLAARYLALFLMLAGVYGSYNVALAWISSTLPRPVEKRAASIALVNTVGNIAQIYSPYLYPSSDGPRYLTAMIANCKSLASPLCYSFTDLRTACFCLACIFATLTLRWCLKNENKKLATLEAQQVQGAADEVEKEGVEQEEIVDASARGGVLVLREGFRYVL